MAAPLRRVRPGPTAARAGRDPLFTALLWVIEFYDATGGRLDYDGIVPRTADGLEGIVWAPLLHHGFAHLEANTLPFVVFGFLVLAAGRPVRPGHGHDLGARRAGGLADGAGRLVTVGMSGVIFGWLTFLLVRGFFARSGLQILLAWWLFLLWGSVLIGVLPGQPDVSWQGHLFGALAGVLAAWLVARRGAPTRAASRAADGSRGSSPAPGRPRSRLDA